MPDSKPSTDLLPAPKIPGLAQFKATFAKAHGTDVLRSGGEIKPYEVISTGSALLDFATGIGGLPEGRVAEWWGPDGSGKSTMAGLTCAEAQRKYPNKIAGYVDMEQTVDLAYFKALGVDVDSDRWAHVQPDSAEDLADIAKSMLESKLFSIVVIDSIGGMVTEEEMQKDAEKDVVGTLAKVVTRMVKIAAVEARKSGTVVLCLNQVRDKIGGYGFSETTGGGWALKHGTSMRMRFRRTQTGDTDPFKIGSGDDVTSVGYETAVIVEKNKCAPPKRRATLAIFNQYTEKFGPVGIDQCNEVGNLTERLKLLPKKGSWFLIDGEDDKVNGLPALKERLRSDLDLRDELRAKALSQVSHLVTDDDAMPDEPEAKPSAAKRGFRKGVPAAQEEGKDVLEEATV